MNKYLLFIASASASVTASAFAAPTPVSIKADALAKAYSLQSCSVVSADPEYTSISEEQKAVYLYNYNCLNAIANDMRPLLNSLFEKKIGKKTVLQGENLNLVLNKILDGCVANVVVSSAEDSEKPKNDAPLCRFDSVRADIESLTKALE